MKQIALSLLFLFVLIQSTFAEALPAYSKKYDPTRDAMQDGRDAIKLATKTNRRILIEVGGDWCKWCHYLENYLNKNQKVKNQLHETFVLLKVNVSEENYNSEFLKVFPKPNGYPYMYVMEKTGELLLADDMAEFYSNGHYSEKAFFSFFKRWAVNKKSEKSLKQHAAK